MRYVLVEIGCLECGNPSKIIDIFFIKEIADEVRNTMLKDTGKYDTGRYALEVLEFIYEPE